MNIVYIVENLTHLSCGCRCPTDITVLKSFSFIPEYILSICGVFPHIDCPVRACSAEARPAACPVAKQVPMTRIEARASWVAEMQRPAKNTPSISALVSARNGIEAGSG